MTANTLQVYGWELHFQAGTSDKFYRVVVADRLVIAHFGHRGTAGQFKVYASGSFNDALHKAKEKSNEKEDKGYTLTRDFTVFEVSEEVVTSIDPLSPGRVNLDSLSRALVTAADEQGTAIAGAAR